MGYYMRFIVTDEKKVSLTELESGLRQTDADYRIDKGENEEREGVLIHSEAVYGELSVNEPKDGLFDEEIEELKEFLEEADESAAKEKVSEVLNRAKSLIAIRVLSQSRGIEETFEKLDPVWNWLFENRQGLLQADAEGYYDASGLVLEVD
ncbi:MAG TPA: hypothetical protein VF599_23195 [Pyrinomonadaceae bacterium]|jgi:hypothetical protein